MKVKIPYVKLTIIILLSISQISVFGQASSGPAHIVGFETGMFNRGLAGMSYQRLFIQKKRLMLGGGAGLGIGVVPFGGALNQFYYFTVTSGIGFQLAKTQFYLSPGLDFKYINYHDGVYKKSIDQYVSIHYEGFGAMPYLGLTIIEEKLFLQLRAAPLFLMNGIKIAEVTPGVGLTAGLMIR